MELVPDSQGEEIRLRLQCGANFPTGVTIYFGDYRSGAPVAKATPRSQDQPGIENRARLLHEQCRGRNGFPGGLERRARTEDAIEDPQNRRSASAESCLPHIV